LAAFELTPEGGKVHLVVLYPLISLLAGLLLLIVFGWGIWKLRH
jgi:hypothetical protein